MIHLDQKLTVTTNVERRAVRVKFEDQPDPADTVTLSLTVDQARELAFQLIWHAFGLEQRLGNPRPVSAPGSEYEAGASGLVPADEPEAAPPWSDRLAFDPNVSDASPVVKGTWVTAGHVVSLIVDGWTWYDILRCHPELAEDDIRACLAYTLAEEERGESVA